MLSEQVLIGRGLFLECWKEVCRKRSSENRNQSKFSLQIVGANGKEVPPVPIPNTEVKLFHVENTWLATARENR